MVKPDFFVRDHLGSVRAVVSGDGRVLETNSYYPYGMRIDALSKTYYGSGDVENRYKYNGKEEFSDLQWLNYGARFYDAAVGRWWVRDPKAEKAQAWTPYRYAFDSPVNVVDPDGRLEDDYIFNRKGEFVKKVETDAPDRIIIQNEEGKQVAEMTVGPDEYLEKRYNRNYNQFDIRGDDKATEIFKFFARHTYVEWGLVRYGKDRNKIYTTNSSQDIGSKIPYQLLINGYYVREDIHSHPPREVSVYYPSGYRKGDENTGDRDNADWYAKYYPHVKLYVYEPNFDTFLEYNKDKAQIIYKKDGKWVKVWVKRPKK